MKKSDKRMLLYLYLDPVYVDHRPIITDFEEIVGYGDGASCVIDVIRKILYKNLKITEFGCGCDGCGIRVILRMEDKINELSGEEIFGQNKKRM